MTDESQDEWAESARLHRDMMVTQIEAARTITSYYKPVNDAWNDGLPERYAADLALRERQTVALEIEAGAFERIAAALEAIAHRPFP